MKFSNIYFKTVLALSLLAIVGCSTTPSKLERIEANEASILNLNAQVNSNKINIERNRKGIDDTNIRVDRMFEKSQYK